MGSSSVEDDNGILWGWAVQDIADLWNQHTKDLKLRAFVDSSNSRHKSCQRLTILLKQNAQWLDASSKADLDYLFDGFRAKLHLALIYLNDKGLDEANNILGAQYTITLGFWHFCRDFKNIHHLSCLALGQEPDAALIADQDRRRAKAQAIKAHAQAWKEVERMMSYRLDAQQIKMLGKTVRDALATIEDEIDFLGR